METINQRVEALRQQARDAGYICGGDPLWAEYLRLCELGMPPAEASKKLLNKGSSGRNC